MPAWLLSFLVPTVLTLIQKYGIPAIELQWPGLVPLINEILAFLGQGPTALPSVPLQAAAAHYNEKMQQPTKAS
jgi:hypothetical protein